LEQEGRFEEAAELHRAWIEREPKEARHHVAAGLDLARAGQYERAVDLLRQATRLDPDNAVSHYHLAETLFEAAQAKGAEDSTRAAWLREAVGAAERSAQCNPAFADAYLVWGQSLRRLGDAAAAVEPLSKGVARRPEEFALQLALGEALLDAGRFKEAETPLENARKLDPRDERPTRALERLRRKGG
jgi:tetratricopeptide (TPR) repeat protein